MGQRERAHRSEGSSAAPSVLELQETLYESANPTRRWLHRGRRAWIEAELRRVAGAGVERALEIGPGCGVYLTTLALLADSVVATDIEPSFIENAAHELSNLPRLSLLVDDITNTTLEPESFDLVLCTEVIEHIADSPRVLRSIASVLRPGGTLVLSTPQRWCPLELVARVAFRPGLIRIVRAVYREPVLDMGHINVLTSRQLTEQLVAAGLTIESRHTGGVYVPLLAEVGGKSAQHFASWLEPYLRRSPFRSLLWTQHIVARR